MFFGFSGLNFETEGTFSTLTVLFVESLTDCVMLLADVVFISKDWARSQGWTDMCSAVKLASQLCKPQ